MSENQWDAIVIGAGAAGLSAAQMLGRSRRRTLVIDSAAPRNRFAAHMHGVLGQDGTAPFDLLARGRAEAAAYGVDIRTGSVERVDVQSDHVTVTLADGRIETARAVLVATGLADDLPDIPGLGEHWGTGVLHCPYCHGWEVRDRALGVLLTSPLGLHQAQLVRQLTDSVVVFAASIDPVDSEMKRRLAARNVEIVTDPVVEVLGEERELTGVRLSGGRVVPLGAIFTAATMRPLDSFLAHLGLDRAETPVGSFLAVDQTGRTSAARIWAAGNVVNPAANVPISMGAGALAGAAVNAALVEEDFDAAVSARQHVLPVHDGPEVAPAAYWEQRYAGSDRVWSGRPNATLVHVAAGLRPGRALDLGCGEGADTIWLAAQGWDATGVDISPTAITRATEAARSSGVGARFVAADLSNGEVGEGEYDLVTASFLHSPVALDRTRALRRAAERVAVGGRLLIVSHAAPPPWASPEHVRDHVFLSPEQELVELALDPAIWTTEIAEVRTRDATAPHGAPGHLADGILLIRRTG
jgi:thioredoxin reductase/SAM-dependent methyltransferase